MKLELAQQAPSNETATNTSDYLSSPQANDLYAADGGSKAAQKAAELNANAVIEAALSKTPAILISSPEAELEKKAGITSFKTAEGYLMFGKPPQADGLDALDKKTLDKAIEKAVYKAEMKTSISSAVDMAGLETEVEAAAIKKIVGQAVDKAAIKTAIGKSVDMAVLETATIKIAVNVAVDMAVLDESVDKAVVKAVLEQAVDKAAVSKGIDKTAVKMALEQAVDKAVIALDFEASAIKTAIGKVVDKAAIHKAVDKAAIKTELVKAVDRATVDKAAMKPPIGLAVDKAGLETEVETAAIKKVISQAVDKTAIKTSIDKSVDMAAVENAAVKATLGTAINMVAGGPITESAVTVADHAWRRKAALLADSMKRETGQTAEPMPRYMRDFTDKSLFQYAKALDELKLPVREKAAALMAQIMEGNNPALGNLTGKLNMQSAAFIASSGIQSETEAHAAMDILSGAKLDTMISALSASVNGTDNMPELFEQMFTNINKDDGNLAKQLSQSGKELLEKLTLIEDEVSRMSSPQRAEALVQIQQLINHVNTLNSIEHLVYMQLPIKLSEQKTTAELYIFKRKGKKKIDPENVNILLAIDLQHLGRWEGLLNIQGKDVSVKMDVPGEQEKGFFGANTVMLHRLLHDSGFSLKNSAITYSGEDTTPLTAMISFSRLSTGQRSNLSIMDLTA